MSARTSQDICETCASYAYVGAPGDQDLGECRRALPVLRDSGFGAFPIVRSDWWCDQYREKHRAEGK